MQTPCDARRLFLSMSVDARRPYDIDSLTDVAVRVFAERGYDGSSMDDVARAAGITKASIYHHVPGKEALLARCLDRALDALWAIFEEPGANRGDAASRVHFVVRRVAEVTFGLLPELSVLFTIRGNTPTEQRALERRRSFDRAVADVVREAQAAGKLRPDVDPAVATRLIFGMSNSAAQWFQPSGRLSAGELGATIATLAFEGLSFDGRRSTQ